MVPLPMHHASEAATSGNTDVSQARYGTSPVRSRLRWTLSRHVGRPSWFPNRPNVRYALSAFTQGQLTHTTPLLYRMTDITVHIPVLPHEIMEHGNPQPGEIWVDGTAGGGGHLQLFSNAVADSGHVIGIDRDSIAIHKLATFGRKNVTLAHESYDNLPEILQLNGIPAVHGILLDLGLSSDQLADRSRGFSFQGEGELDMRFDQTRGEAAWEWLDRSDEKSIADAIYQFGEERHSRRIARRIVETRQQDPIRTVDQLRELIYRSVPAGRPTKGGRKHGNVDPATRTFQALRIVVNDELSIVQRALERLPDTLATGGTFLIISFHSLEDRLVKYAFRNDPRLEVITKKPIQASEAEIAANPRSRSAKLRIAKRATAEQQERNRQAAVPMPSMNFR